MKQLEISLSDTSDEVIIVEKLEGDNNGGVIHNLHCENDDAYNSAIDGFTALVLAQVCGGIDYSTPEYAESCRTAFDAICNNV